MRIVSISDLICDVYYDKNMNILGAFGGGSAGNIICNLQEMGFETFMYGACGNDYLGRICIDSLNDCNVDNKIDIIDNLNTKTYHILEIKDNNRYIYRSIKYCPFCKKDSFYDNSYINSKKIIKDLLKNDILLFDNLNINNQYIIDNTNNLKLLDLGTYYEFENLSKKEIINKLANKFVIINLNERVEKYLIKKLNCDNVINLSKLIKAKLLIVTRGTKGNDFIYKNNLYSFPLDKIINEVDDSGAGDAFFSTIIKNWLNNKQTFDESKFNQWVKDTRLLVEKVLKLIGSRSYIKRLYKVGKSDICLDELEYKLYIPSGNPTALVLNMESNSIKRKIINDYLMNKYDYIEQVGFINPKNNKPELLMAGGEFCGNATRCAIYYYLDGKEGNLKIKISGVRNKLKAGIDKDNNVWVDMPIIKGNYENSISIINDQKAIIKLYGITQLIYEVNNINQKYNKEELKKYAYSILKKNKLLDEEAAGVMFIEKKDNKILLSPIVFVKEINTLFYETACGSGSVAVGIYESFKEKKSVNIDVLQPSGKVINVITSATKTKIIKARISGKVKEIEAIK